MSKRMITDIIKQLRDALTERYPDLTTCQQTAWWMLEAVTHIDKAHLIVKESIELSEQQQDTLHNWIYQQVHHHKPLQYILGSVPFDDLDIIVRPPVLIPRPETEEWTMHFIFKLKKANITQLTILDLCSGSGCIGLALANALPQSHVYAVDISPLAIELGKQNAEHNKINNITFIQSDLYAALPKDLRFDMIVSNPPYIPANQWTTLDASVAEWEDPRALIADDNGLAIIKDIVANAPFYLQPNNQLARYKIPQLIIEIDSPQAETVKQLYRDAGFVTIAVKKDLEGKERIVVGSMHCVADTEDESGDNQLHVHPSTSHSRSHCC